MTPFQPTATGAKRVQWYGPEEQWPRHGRQMADEALDRARNAGWWLRHSGGRSSKVYGWMCCRKTDGGRREESCSETILLSPKGPEDGSETARVIDNAIRGCRHVASATDAADRGGRLERAEGHLRTAERLIEALGKLLAGAKTRAAAMQALEEADAFANDAERELDRLVEEEQAAAASLAQAQGLASAAGEGYADEPWPPEDATSRLVEPADENLGAAEAQLDGLGASRLADQERLRSRLAVARGRLKGLRERVMEVDGR